MQSGQELAVPECATINVDADGGWAKAPTSTGVPISMSTACDNATRQEGELFTTCPPPQSLSLHGPRSPSTSNCHLVHAFGPATGPSMDTITDQELPSGLILQVLNSKGLD